MVPSLQDVQQPSSSDGEGLSTQSTPVNVHNHIIGLFVRFLTVTDIALRV